MSIIEEALKDEAQQGAQIAPEISGEEQEAPRASIGSDISFLRIPTGAGSIDDYLDHPLNNNKSKGMAQVLRGFSGIAGDLSLAIIDICIGALNIAKERKNEAIDGK